MARKAMVVSACLGLLSASAVALSTRPWGGGPAEVHQGLEISPRSQRLVADDPGKKLVAFYRVKNHDKQELRFGDVATSCGCSVAAIAPKVLQTGETAVISVEGTPPPFGEKTVDISIRATQETEKLLEFQLTMVSNPAVPYLLSSSGPVQFGEVVGDAAPQSFWVETIEEATSPPWLTPATPSTNLMLCEGGIKEESPDEGLVRRKYIFSVRFAQQPPFGRVSEIISLGGAGPAGRHEIKVAALSSPAVYASPSTLYASVAPGDGRPSLIVRIKTLDSGSRLEVTPVEPGPSSLSIQKINEGERDATFQIAPKSELTENLDEKLRFVTNHRDIPEVVVPISIELSMESGK